MARVLLAISLFAMLAGCAGAKVVPDPVGIGSGAHELKKSPCACMEVPMTMPGDTVVEG